VESRVPNSAFVSGEGEDSVERLVPDSDGAIVGAGGDEFIAGAHSHCVYGLFVAHDSGDCRVDFCEIAAGLADGPDLDGLVLAH